MEKKPITVQLTVSKALLITSNESTDTISLTLEGVRGFPAMGYVTTANIETQQGCGADVCLALGIVPEVIDISATRVPFSRNKRRAKS